MTNEEIMWAWNQECKIERGTPELVIAFARLIQQAQREEDANLVDNLYHETYMRNIRDCAAAIRKGGAA